MKERNTLLSLVKLLFVVCIIIMHSNVPFKNSSDFMEGAYIFVDFFFVLQGFFLLRKSITNTDNAPITYLKKSFAKFFPIIMVETICFLIYNICLIAKGKKQMLEIMMKACIDLSFLSSVLPVNYIANYTLWFVSAYTIVGFICVYIYNRQRTNTLIIAFISAIWGYGMIFLNEPNLDIWEGLCIIGIPYAIVRAFAGISLGIITSIVVNQINRYQLHKALLVVSRVLIVGLITLLTVSIIYKPHTILDSIYIILIAILLTLISLNQNKVSSKYLEELCDVMTMPMYIFQVLAIGITNYFIDSSIITAVFALLLDFILAVIWVYFLDGKIKSLMKKIVKYTVICKKTIEEYKKE